MSKTDKVSFEKIRSGFFFSLIIILTIALLYLFRPFFFPIFWAAVIAIMFYPHYEWLNTYLKMPTLNAAIMVAVVILTIFVPLTLFVSLVVNQSFSLYQEFSQAGNLPDVRGVATWLHNSPLEPYVQNLQANWQSQAAAISKKISDYSLSFLKSFTQNSAHFLFQVFIMFYTLFFFFRDGKNILLRLMHLSPLGEEYDRMLYNHFTSTARATLKSSLIVGVIQGALGGLVFWITQVPGALILGLFMMVLCLIPALGAFIIWLPAGLGMIIFGHVWEGMVIIVFGSLVLSTIDNFLRPPLIGKDTQMHPLFVLFSTLGGIFLFGVSGFIIGPVIASLYLAIISIYHHYYEHELQN